MSETWEQSRRLQHSKQQSIACMRINLQPHTPAPGEEAAVRRQRHRVLHAGGGGDDAVAPQRAVQGPQHGGVLRAADAQLALWELCKGQAGWWGRAGTGWCSADSKRLLQSIRVQNEGTSWRSHL